MASNLDSNILPSFNSLFEYIASNTLNNETRSKSLVLGDYRRSMTELSKFLAGLFPLSSAKRSQALKDAKEVFDQWGSNFGIGNVPEEAEEAMSMRLRKLGALKEAIPISAIVILTEFEHLKRDFEQVIKNIEREEIGSLLSSS